ncbi:hypothetical protein Tco_1512876, partial [Tanacetum coccineum]
MTGAKFDIETFDGTSDFGIWRFKMRDLLINPTMMCECTLQHVVTLSTTEAEYMAFTKVVKEAIWLKRVTIKSGFKLKIVAGIAIGALLKAIPSP